MAGFVPYLGCGSALLGAPKRSRVSRGDIVSGLGSPRTRVALIVLAVVNLVMVTAMAIAPVHLRAHGLGVVRIIVAVHVEGMLVPSPISGWMSDRIDPTPVVRRFYSPVLKVRKDRFGDPGSHIQCKTLVRQSHRKHQPLGQHATAGSALILKPVDCDCDRNRNSPLSSDI